MAHSVLKGEPMRKQLVLAFLFAGLFASGCVAPTPDADPAGNGNAAASTDAPSVFDVSGRTVYRPDLNVASGTAKPNAVLHLAHLDGSDGINGNPVPRLTQSAGDGWFLFAGVPAGDYVVWDGSTKVADATVVDRDVDLGDREDGWAY
jgi:hypothetical protein